MSSEEIRVTHVGSLVRPDDFAALLRRRMAGQCEDHEAAGAKLASKALRQRRAAATANKRRKTR